MKSRLYVITREIAEPKRWDRNYCFIGIALVSMSLWGLAWMVWEYVK